MAGHQLLLKQGLIVMLLQSLQPANGPLEGAQCIVVSTANNVLFLRSVYERGNIKRFFLPSASFKHGDEAFALQKSLKPSF